MAKFEILRKITVKDVLNGIDKKAYPNASITGAKEHRQSFIVVFGRVTGIASMETDKGPYIAFKGMFEAHRSADGAVFKSSNLILPNPAQETLEQAYIAALPTNEDGSPDFARPQPFAFGFDIGGEPNETSSTKYRFTCAPIDIGDDAENDPLAGLRSKAQAALPATQEHKALPAPDAPEPEAAPATGKAKDKAPA